MTKRKNNLGNFGENLAVKFLENNNIKILTRNFHSAYGEIDIVAMEGDEILFIEVKTRSKSISSAKSSISHKKQQKIKMTANIFLSKNPDLQDHFTRFDVILILTHNTNFEIKYIKDAFR